MNDATADMILDALRAIAHATEERNRIIQASDDAAERRHAESRKWQEEYMAYLKDQQRWSVESGGSDVRVFRSRFEIEMPDKTEIKDPPPDLETKTE